MYFSAFGGFDIQDDAMGVFIVGDIAVIAELVLHIEKDQDAAGDPDRKSQQIDERIPLMAGDVPEGCFEIVFKHLNEPQFPLIRSKNHTNVASRGFRILFNRKCPFSNRSCTHLNRIEDSPYQL